ncbi:hypothetical protein GCM10010446_23480 [Streptomyces enissocaesilis]|uniref:Uncharacterized protein n=1 Tax=Streptomyces enissocaesilis TaxID=332589 RepID=A0ABP6JP58_9ACTN
MAEVPGLGATAANGGKPVQPRDVPAHSAEECARHNGHADFLRGRIDGRGGERGTVCGRGPVRRRVSRPAPRCSP